MGLPLLSAYSKCNEANSNQEKMANPKKGKLGIALVGLGNYATNQLAPALQQTEECYGKSGRKLETVERTMQ